MRSIRVRALALVGAAVLTPQLFAASDAQLPRVDFSTPLSTITRLSEVARVREVSRTMSAIFYNTMGVPVPMVKRLGMKADYYDAWRARIQDRAFPKNEIDPRVYPLAVEQRLRMTPAPPMGIGTKGRVNNVLGRETTGALWEAIGPFRTSVPYEIYYGPANSYVSGRVGGIAFDPIDPKIVYQTAAAGGVWKTTNGGVNWTPLVNGIQAPYLGPIAVSPTNRNLILTGAGDFDGGVGGGDGLFRSLDGGATWAHVAKTQIANVAFSSIVFDPTTPGRVLATSGRRGVLNGRNSSGLWESKDSGLTWTKRFITNPLQPETVSLDGISFGAADTTGKRSAVMSREYPAGVYYSKDSAKTWIEITSYPARNRNVRTVAVASPTDPNVVYAAADGFQQVYKGVRNPTKNLWVWTDITRGREGDDNDDLPGSNDEYNWSQSSYDMHMGVAKHVVNGVARDTVYLGLITIAAFDGNGWTDIGASFAGESGNLPIRTHNDQHNFAVFPGDSSQMAFGNDGGIYGLKIAANGTHTINANMNGDSTMAMFYSGAWHPTDPNKMFGGTQDNASPVATGDLNKWENRTGGDGTGAAIDGQNPNRQYGAAQFLTMYRTTDAWASQQYFRGGFDDPAGLPFIGRFAADKSPEGMLYVGSNSRLHQFNASTNTWTDYLGEQDFVGQPRAIAPAPSDPNTIYVGTTAGRMYVTRDRGTTWEELPGSGGVGTVTGFAVHPTRPRDVLVSAGADVFQLYDVNDEPQIRVVSGSAGGALPRIFAADIERNQASPDTTWYVATDVGVFGTVNGGVTWFNMTEPLGLPPVEVSAIEHTPGTGYLNIATYGRGMWRLKLTDVKTPALVTVSGTIRRTASNVVAVTLRITNTGPVPATMVKVPSAYLVFPGAVYNSFTIMPTNVGTIAPGTSKDVVVTYRDNYLQRSGLQGFVVPNITWISGTQTVGYNDAISVRLP